MSSPNTNFIANKNIRRRSTFQFIKECNELSISSSSSRPPLSPDFFASVYHQLHSIDNLHESGSTPVVESPTVPQQSSTSKVTSMLESSVSDIGAVNSSRLPMINFGGTLLSPIESNSSKTVDCQDGCGPPSKSAQQSKKSLDLCSRLLSGSSCTQSADHICEIQPGGIEESCDRG